MAKTIEIDIHPYIDDCGQTVIRIMAFEGKEIIGSLYASYQERKASLDSIQVNPPFRGRGVGSMLINKLVIALQAEEINEIIGEMRPEYGLHYDEVQSFYKKNGFSVDSDYNLHRRV